MDTALKDGDMVSLGNETIQAIEAKGHTDCSMAYALEPDGILFTSESTGIVEAGLAINTPILKSFADAMTSLEKCRGYGAKYICLPHFGLIPQDFNEEYWMQFQQGCEDRIQMVREMKKEGLDADQMLERYRDRYLGSRRGAGAAYRSVFNKCEEHYQSLRCVLWMKNKRRSCHEGFDRCGHAE